MDRRLLWRLRSALLAAGESWEMVRRLSLAEASRLAERCAKSSSVTGRR